MADVYESCPVLENERFMLRLVSAEDADDLTEVYGDKQALPFFNSDNCHGDNFYYPTRERMLKAIEFWLCSYENKWFVRWAVIDKSTSKAVGTIELFHRTANDAFGDSGVLRLDVGSAYETREALGDILSVIIPPAYDLFECDEIVSKVPIYAVEREEAFGGYGFVRSDECLVGEDGYAYNGYMLISG